MPAMSNEYMREYRRKNPGYNKKSAAKFYTKNREKILEQKRNAPPGYNSWKSMRQRCDNPNRADYKYYGGKGIVYCKRWDSFQQFISDMGHPPTKKHTIDRIDNDIGYNPDNCKWATRTEQGKNTSIVKRIEYNGEKKSIIDWAKKFNIKPQTLYSRLNRSKWSIEKALGQG